MISPTPGQFTAASPHLHPDLSSSQGDSLFPHLHPWVVSVMSGTDAQRIEHARIAEFVEHPRAMQLLTMLERLHASTMRREDFQDRVNGMLIAGPTFSGKTRLARHFLSLHPRDPNPGGDHVIQTVAYALSPDGPSVTDLYHRILHGLGAFCTPRERQTVLRQRVCDTAQLCGLRVLFLDEIHSVLQGTPRQQRILMTALKNLANQLSVSIVLLGTHAAASAIAAGEELATRFPLERLFSWEQDNDDFGRLLLGFEKQLPLYRASDLDLQSARLHSLCGGSLGELARLLALATELAILHGQEQINDRVLDLTVDAGWLSPAMRAAQLLALETGGTPRAVR